MYVPHVQNSFYHFRTVVTHATFGLQAVAAFVVSRNMLTSDWIRYETVIIVNGDDPLSRLHIPHCFVGIVHWSKQPLEAIVYVWRGSHLLYHSCALACPFNHILIDIQATREKYKNQWTTCEYGACKYQVTIELYFMCIHLNYIVNHYKMNHNTHMTRPEKTDHIYI